MTRHVPSDYEQQQLARIQAWREEAPNFVSRTIGKAAGPATAAVERVIPTAALRIALQGVQSAGTRLGDRKSVLRRAGVGQLDELQRLSLEACDAVAGGVRTRGSLLAAGSGAAFGFAGVFGLAGDVPTLLVQAFRVIHRIGLCYGEDCADEELQRLPVGIFALASANSLAEKHSAFEALEKLGEAGALAWREGMERAAERELAKEAAVISLNELGKRIARRIGLRKAAGSIPVAGALVGGAVNAWYLHDVASAAQRCFQLRWLQRKYGRRMDALAAPAASALEAPIARKPRKRVKKASDAKAS